MRFGTEQPLRICELNRNARGYRVPGDIRVERPAKDLVHSVRPQNVRF